MRELLDREERALTAGDIDVILFCAAEKEVLLGELRDADLDIDVIAELAQKNRKNGELARGGAALLRTVLGGETTYGRNARAVTRQAGVVERLA